MKKSVEKTQKTAIMLVILKELLHKTKNLDKIHKNGEHNMKVGDRYVYNS